MKKRGRTESPLITFRADFFLRSFGSDGFTSWISISFPRVRLLRERENVLNPANHLQFSSTCCPPPSAPFGFCATSVRWNSRAATKFGPFPALIGVMFSVREWRRVEVICRIFLQLTFVLFLVCVSVCV